MVRHCYRYRMEAELSMTHMLQTDAAPALPVRDPSHGGMIAAQRLSAREAEAAAGLGKDDAGLLPLMMCLARLSARQYVQEML